MRLAAGGTKQHTDKTTNFYNISFQVKENISVILFSDSFINQAAFKVESFHWQTGLCSRLYTL